jgi:hypothetical protein
MLPSRRPRRTRGVHRRRSGRRHPHRLLRSPSFLVTSVAAIGGLSAVGAAPVNDGAGDGGSVGAGVTAPATAAEEISFPEVGAAASTPSVVFDTVDPVRRVDPDAVTLLGSADPPPAPAPGGQGGGAAETMPLDAFDPAEFEVVAAGEAADEDGAPPDEETTPAEDAASLVYEGADGEHIDPERIRTWLDGRGYPLADYAEELVAAGIDHQVDPRLIVGIAVIESSGGKRLPPSTHNAWGWSGNGPHGLKSWASWPEAIDAFTEGLARVYDTDNVDERMARKYVPPNWQKWLRTVRWVMDDI